MIKLKYSKYEDFNPVLLLRDGIPDLTPYKVNLPPPPPMEEFINFGLPKEEQFFKYEEIPAWVNQYDREIFKGYDERERYGEIINNIPEYREFIFDQWRKREEGVWMYIYGKPLYITGLNWFFINYYRHMGQRLSFRYEDAEYWYWWKFCVKDNKRCLGGIEMARRQEGKSTRAGCIILEDETKGQYKFTGMQSKDESSIKTFMSKCIVDPFNKLPFYFRPVHNSSRLAPSKKLELRHPHDKEDSLYNWVEIRPASEKAFDGETLTGYMLDEAGKTEEMMVSETWDVHRECLRHLGGKGIVTSTVEESTKGGMDEFKKIWDRSDHAELNVKGETESGLYRYFRPSFQTIRFDRYGFSIVDDPTDEQRKWLEEKGEVNPHMGGKEIIDGMIDAVKDTTKKAALIRKYPRTIREAFRKNATDCHFDIIRINQQLDKYLYSDNEVIGGNPDVIIGNFSWKDNKQDTEVVFRECPEGRWKIHRKLFKYLSKRANQFRFNNVGEKIPLNKNLGCLGADPFKYDATDEKRKSLGTFHGYVNYSIGIENEYQEDGGEGQITDNFFLEYGYRQDNTMLYGEDVIMSCVFFGMQVFPEINVPTLVQYMKIRGYGGYLKFRKMWKKVEGRWTFQVSANAGMQTSSEQVINSLFSYVTDYLYNHCERCVFPRTLEDFANVERNYLKDYDYFVSASYALYGAKNDHVEDTKEDKKEKVEQMSNPLNFLKA